MTRTALVAIALSTSALAVAYVGAFLPGGAPRWTPWLFMAALSVMMVAFMALGAARRGGLGRLTLPLAGTLALLLAAFSLALLLPPPDPADPVLWLGLPPGAAVIVYGVGLLPFLLVPTAYAWSFPDQGLSEPEVARIRDEAMRARREGPGTHPPVGSEG